MFHIYSVPFADNTERMGYPRPKHAICVCFIKYLLIQRIYHLFIFEIDLADDT